MSNISELVAFANADEITYKEITLGVIPNALGQEINAQTQVFVRGATKVLSSAGIRHAFNSHGDNIQESKRGQVGITDADFEKLPTIFGSADSFVKGNNPNSVVFIKKIKGNTYHVVMNAIKATDKLTLIFKTMYIKK